MNPITLSWTIVFAMLVATQAAGQGVRAGSTNHSQRPCRSWAEAEQFGQTIAGQTVRNKPGDIIAKSDVHAALAQLESMVGRRPTGKKSSRRPPAMKNSLSSGCAPQKV